MTSRRTAQSDDTFQWPPPIDDEPDIIWLDGKGAPVIRQTPKAARKDPPSSAARRPIPTPGPRADVRLASRRAILGDLDLHEPPSRGPAADLNLRVPPRSNSRPGSTRPTGTMRRPAQRHSGTGLAVLVVLLFACVTLAGEYVVREMGTPDVGTVLATLNRAWGSAAPALETLVASLNRAWSSAAPARGEQTAPDVEPQPLVQAPLSSAALVTPLQPFLPSEQRLLDLDPREDNQFQLDRRSKEGPAVTANKGVTTTPRAVATVGSERRSARPVDVLTATRETPPATPTARSTPPASRPDQGVLQTSAQEQRGEIEDVLRRYELAYRRLDAGGAKAVWPALDERTLARSFDGLSWQEVRFDRCIIHLSSPDAEAVCAGVAAYARKAGNREPRSERRRWTFQLRKADGAWTIVRADARQDDRP